VREKERSDLRLEGLKEISKSKKKSKKQARKEESKTKRTKEKGINYPAAGLKAKKLMKKIVNKNVEQLLKL